MDNVVLLVVSPAEGLRQSLASMLPGSTVVRLEGDRAIEWLETNSCDLCVLDHQPVETVLRVRLRLPTTPIIAVGLEAPALGDVVTSVTADHDLRSLILRLLPLHASRQRSQEPELWSRPSLLDVPDQLKRPTYQNRLRVIGSELDAARCTAVHLVRVDGGFVVRAVSRRTGQPSVLVFPDRDFPVLAARAHAARGRRGRMRLGTPLLPTGYEDFLRALGRWLDETHVLLVRLVEEPDAIRIEGTRVADEKVKNRRVPFRERLGREEIGVLLAEAFRHRFEQLPETGRSPDSGA